MTKERKLGFASCMSHPFSDSWGSLALGTFHSSLRLGVLHFGKHTGDCSGFNLVPFLPPM